MPLLQQLKKMEHECGARENLFRLEGGNIKAVPLCIEQRRIKAVGTLRLYCIRISDKLLVIGNGGVKKTTKYQQDPVLLGIVNQLKQIEHQIFVESRKAHAGYDDFDIMKSIIETITL